MQLTVEFDIPPDLTDGFRSLIGKLRNHIVRQAIRSAMIPPRNMLKAKLMALPKGTDHVRGSGQSSGASLRATTFKYGQNKTDPNRFYGIVGVNARAAEAIWPHERSPVYRNANTRMVNFGILNRKPDKSGVRTMSKRWKPKEVRSTLKRRYGVRNTSKSMGQRLRKPNRYWHMVESGFNATDSRGPWAGKRHRAFGGHHFVEQTTISAGPEAREIFETRFRQLLRKAAT
jgi:hypothetical protein